MLPKILPNYMGWKRYSIVRDEEKWTAIMLIYDRCLFIVCDSLLGGRCVDGAVMSGVDVVSGGGRRLCACFCPCLWQRLGTVDALIVILLMAWQLFMYKYHIFLDC